jgi:hypothetical protein
MKGTFRLTGAEFKKIFKRPSVFIMALILIATIFVSLYIYKPTNATDLTVNYDLSTSIEYYNTFYKEDLVDTEKGINKVFDNADSLIDYHKQNSTRSKNLYFYYKVEGYTCFEIIANSIEEAKFIANQEMCETDFKELYEIDWDFIKIEDKNGNELLKI